MENSSFIAETELTNMVNDSIKELHDILILSFGEEYGIKTSASFSLTGGVDTYALTSIASDFYKLWAVDYQMSNNYWINLQKMNLQDRNKFQYSIINFHPYYNVVGNNIFLKPSQFFGNAAIRIWYVPVATVLVSDSDTLSDMDAWLDYIKLSVAIKMLNKEESDTAQFLREKAELKQQILEAANMKDLGSSTGIADVSKVASPYEYYNFDL
jgi:hypothetical protein